MALWPSARPLLAGRFPSRYCHSEGLILARGICCLSGRPNGQQIPPPPRSEFGMTVKKKLRKGQSRLPLPSSAHELPKQPQVLSSYITTEDTENTEAFDCGSS